MMHNTMGKTACGDEVKNLLTYRLLSSHSDDPIPFHYFKDTASELVKDEDVPVIDRQYIPQLEPERLATMDNSPLAIPLRKCNRRVAEFSTQYVQLVSSVLIHTKKTIVLLRLKRDNIHVDGYRINTVTVPEGHVSWEEPHFNDTFSIAHFHPKFIVNTIVRAGAFRELGEEIKVRDDIDYTKVAPGLLYNGRNMQESWNHYIAKTLKGEGDHVKLRTVFVPEVGSSIKHLLFCWDIGINDPGWESMVDDYRFLESNEPEKHEVIYVHDDEISKYIYNYDLYVKELFAQCADDWLWKFVGDSIVHFN